MSLDDLKGLFRGFIPVHSAQKWSLIEKIENWNWKLKIGRKNREQAQTNLWFG